MDNEPDLESLLKAIIKPHEAEPPNEAMQMYAILNKDLKDPLTRKECDELDSLKEQMEYKGYDHGLITKITVERLKRKNYDKRLIKKRVSEMPSASGLDKKELNELVAELENYTHHSSKVYVKGIPDIPLPTVTEVKLSEYKTRLNQLEEQRRYDIKQTAKTALIGAGVLAGAAGVIGGVYSLFAYASTYVLAAGIGTFTGAVGLPLCNLFAANAEKKQADPGFIRASGMAGLIGGPIGGPIGYAIMKHGDIIDKSPEAMDMLMGAGLGGMVGGLAVLMALIAGGAMYK